jgi:hypothetical protein
MRETDIKKQADSSSSEDDIVVFPQSFLFYIKGVFDGYK